MKKNNILLALSLLAVLSIGMPQTSKANTAIEITEQITPVVSITVAQSILHITGANGQTLQIYNVTGVCVMNIRIEGNDKRYDLNLPKGCYIVKVGKVVRKISLR